MVPTGRPERPRRNSSGLARDVEILGVLGGTEALQSAGLGVLRIAELTGRDKAVTSRALATLADAGILARHPDTLAYRLGPRLFALAARTLEATLVAEARPYLRKIARHTGETTHLCVLRGGNVLTLISELSPQEVRTTGWEGVTTAAWRTPSGWVLLSDRDPAEMSAWYADHGHDTAVVGDLAGGPASVYAVRDGAGPERIQVRDLPSLRTVIAGIRARGYATSDEDFELGVVAASVPVTDFTGRVIAAVDVSAPKARIGRLDALGRYLTHAAEPLSRRLGGVLDGTTPPPRAALHAPPDGR
jgi:DNA-binding IclR family transcriptional regulator